MTMATGFDRRQPTRETFAFQPSAPVQEQSRASGQSRGAQLVGGETQGGMIAAGPQTNAGPVAAGLGAFVQQVMAPHIRQRQQEEFFKGFAKAQEGIALDELSHDGSITSKVFGPTAFEQGAQFYTAKATLDKWATDRYAEMDELKKLPPEEAAKLLSQTSTQLMTGNHGADQILQAGLVELSGPLMNTISKAREAWKQEEYGLSWAKSGNQSAAALQALATEQAKAEPGKRDNTVVAGQVQSFLGTMVQPEGMTDENYRKGLFNFMRGAMQDGNFYAVEAMRRAGIDKVFGEDEQVKLQDAYQRYGNRVLGKAAMLKAPDLIRLDTEIKMERISPMEAAGKLADINNALKAETGIDLDLFDFKDIQGAAGKVVDATIASARRAEERRWQIEDRDQRRAWDLEDQQREEAENTAQVQTLWGMGSVNSGIAAGLKAGDFDVLAINDYRTGEVSRIANAYAREGWVSGRVGQMMRAKITSSIGQQYTKDFELGHQEWSKLNAVNPGAAQAYYGNMHVPMQKFDTLRRGGLSPQIAYVRAFGDPAAYSIERVPPERRKAVQPAVEKVIDANEPWSVFGYGLGRTPLNASSRAVLTGALTNEVAIASNNTDVPSEQLAKNAYQALFASGKAERYGQFAWRTKQGTQPLSQMLKLQPKEADAVIVGTIDKRLKAAGFSEGADGDNYEVTRLNDERGQPAIAVQGYSDDEHVPPVVIRLKDLQSEATARRTGQVQGNQPSAASFAARDASKAGLDPYRRIKGETGLQRTIRINREVAEGSSPLRR